MSKQWDKIADRRCRIYDVIQAFKIFTYQQSIAIHENVIIREDDVEQISATVLFYPAMLP